MPIDLHVRAGGFDFACHRTPSTSNDDLIRLTWLYKDGDIVTELHRSGFALLKHVMQINDTVSGWDHVKAEAAVCLRLRFIIDIKRRLRAAIRVVHLVIGVQGYVLIWLELIS